MRPVARRAAITETSTMAALFIALSAAIVLLLGSVHLLYTFRGPKLTPRDPALQASMAQSHPVLTRQTTMWKAWVGFNASHSLGAILFGLIYGYLALAEAGLLFRSRFLLALGAATLIAYVALAQRYWFRIPLTGVALALACYLTGIAIHLVPA
jgi:hypothetical protein